jgi:uncharacterized metal-binding protein YceD (DUF177 family)
LLFESMPRTNKKDDPNETSLLDPEQTIKDHSKPDEIHHELVPMPLQVAVDVTMSLPPVPVPMQVPVQVKALSSTAADEKRRSEALRQAQIRARRTPEEAAIVRAKMAQKARERRASWSEEKRAEMKLKNAMRVAQRRAARTHEQIEADRRANARRAALKRAEDARKKAIAAGGEVPPMPEGEPVTKRRKAATDVVLPVGALPAMPEPVHITQVEGTIQPMPPIESIVDHALLAAPMTEVVDEEDSEDDEADVEGVTEEEKANRAAKKRNRGRK